MIQANQAREYTITLICWPNGFVNPAETFTVNVQARTRKEARRLAKHRYIAGFVKGV